MRWWICSTLLGAALLLGCGNNEKAHTPPMSSLLVFHYDSVREIVIASTYSLSTDRPVTPQRYAEALTRLPEVSYLPTPTPARPTTIRLADPQARVVDSVLTVNYLDVAGLSEISSAQATAALAALEAWFWVPGVRAVYLQAHGRPLTHLGPVRLTYPLTPAYRTYVVHSATGEVGYLAGAPMPATVRDAVDILQRREIAAFPARQGFTPLLPPGMTLTTGPANLVDGVLRVDLPAYFSRSNMAQLSGIVLTLTQFPEVDAVQFTFGGRVASAPFMRTNLDAPVTPYALLLPPLVAREASGETTRTLQALAEQTLGRPADFSSALVWQDLAMITTHAQPGVASQTFAMHMQDGQYTVLSYGPHLSVVQLLKQGMPEDAVTAFRLPGWEHFALAL